MLETFIGIFKAVNVGRNISFLITNKIRIILRLRTVVCVYQYCWVLKNKLTPESSFFFSAKLESTFRRFKTECPLVNAIFSYKLSHVDVTPECYANMLYSVFLHVNVAALRQGNATTRYKKWRSAL